MNFTINIEPYKLNENPNFIRLIERIRQCIREREIIIEQQKHRKIYSIIHYIEHIKRCINDNPLIGRALFRIYNTIKNISSQTNQFSSTLSFDNNESKMSLEEKISIENIYSINNEIDLKSNLSKISLTKSTTHFIQSNNLVRQTSGLMTNATLTAINKVPRLRTTSDIEILVHLLNRCENLRHLPIDVRHYAARSLLFLTYHPNTIVTRQNFPSFLVYIIVYGQCKLLHETNQTTIFGQQLNIGDIYGDDSLKLIIDYHLNGLIINEKTHCNLIGFFSRDIRAYENYFSDMMKQILFEQLRIQSIFLTIQWRKDILDYFLKWTKYKQYSIDEIIYGNEEYEHENLYFILHGQISFVRLIDFPLIAIKYPEYYQKIMKMKILPKQSTEKTTWRFLEIFVLSNGHYFGFESTTIHSWYLSRTTVDIISIPKVRFEELGDFARMIFKKLRQDFLDIYPNEIFIRHFYLKDFQINEMKFNNSTKQSMKTNYQNDFLKKLNPNILRIKFKKIFFFLTNNCFFLFF